MALCHIELILRSLNIGSGRVMLILVLTIAMLFKLFSRTSVMNSDIIGKCSCPMFDVIASIFDVYNFVLMTNTFNPINMTNTQYILKNSNPNNPNDLMTIPIARASTVAPEPLLLTSASLITSLLAKSNHLPF